MGVKIDTRKPLQNAALHLAASQGNANLCKLLVEKGTTMVNDPG
jgi:ankyrin repeat protein